MNSASFNLSKSTAQFLEPLKKHAVRTGSASIIMMGVLYVVVNIGLSEVVRQNSYPIHMLSTELLIEHGPDFAKASKQHAEMIEQFSKHLEKRYLGMGVLYPTCSPKKALASALAGFKKVEKAPEDKKEEEAKKAIWQAGLACHEFYAVMKRFPRSPYAWFKSEDAPKSLLTELDNAFDAFHELVNKLENTQSLEAAVKGCRGGCIDSRRATLLLFATWLSYDNQDKKIERFLSDVKRARDLALLFARTEKYKSEHELFRVRAANMNLRAKVVAAMLDNDMDRVCELMREAIKKALAEKEKAKPAEGAA